MRFNNISVPEVYKESWDFRFFLKWIWECLTKLKYDTEHLIDIYDPLKCKEELLWMLGDTIGWRYDNRLPAAFNRLVLLYFMEMMRRKGSKSGVTFAAEINLAQFNLISYGAGYEDDDGNIVEGKDILYNRLEDSSVPVNSVYVESHTPEGYIDVVYFSTETPVDACIEYVRPLGMYLFQHAGVRFDARTQISIDARLTNINEAWESIGSTHVGHYTRNDYARMQMVEDFPGGTDFYDGAAIQENVPRDHTVDNALHMKTTDTREGVWYRNSIFEGARAEDINPGYRALYSLQLCNNEHVVKALIDPIFSLGYGPQSDDDTYPDDKYYITENDVTVINPKSYLNPPYKEKPVYNLRYDRQQELDITTDVTTLDEHLDHGPGTVTKPIPAVNPIMKSVGDAIAVDDARFTQVDDEGNITIEYLGGDL